MPTVAVNGIELYYERRGAGLPLLFFNGSGATLARTSMMLDPFAAHFDVLAHDQRGLGRTSIPPGPYEMADYAADGAALLDRVGWERCRVAGISFGGMVAQEFAVTFPERVERLALLCTSPGGPFPSYPLHTLGEKPPDEVRGTATTILDTRFTPEWLATHDADRAVTEMATSAWANPAVGEVRRGELEQLDARSRHDVVDRLGRITCPTLVACGRYDGIAPLANGEAIAERVPGAELRVYEGGHVFFAQDPSVFPDVVDFLAAQWGRRAVELNHTIVWCRDQQVSARFLTEVFGLPPATRFGPFLEVDVGNDVTLAFHEVDGDIASQHYAFLVTEAEFDTIFGRVVARSLDYWADPAKAQVRTINTNDGGRGVYFDDPDGHFLEIITRPYGSA